MEAVLTALGKYIIPAFVTFVAAVGWFFRLEWTGKQNAKRLEELEKRIVRDQEHTEKSLIELRSEMNSNFAIVRDTMQQIMLKLSDGTRK